MKCRDILAAGALTFVGYALVVLILFALFGDSHPCAR